MYLYNDLISGNKTLQKFLTDLPFVYVKFKIFWSP
jgi:hypothetical protein